MKSKETTKTTAKKASPATAEKKPAKTAAPKKVASAPVSTPVETPKKVASAPVSTPVETPRPPAVRIDWELSAAWEAVGMVERGEGLEQHARFRDVLSAHLKNFIQYGQSSLTPYEIGRVAEGILKTNGVSETNGAFVAGDRVRIAMKDGSETRESQGIVVGTKKNEVRVLAVSPEGQYASLASGEGKGKVQILGIVASAPV